MDKKMVRLRKLCSCLYTGNIYLLLMEFALTLFSRKPLSPGYILLFWCLLAGIYLAQEWMPRILGQLAVHALFGAAVGFLVGDTYVRWLLILTLFFLFFEAADYIRRGYKVRPVGDMPWPVFLLAAVVCGYGFYMKNSFLLRVGYIIPLILFLLYLLMMYLDGMEKYVNATRHVSGIPQHEMLFANTILIGGILLLALLLIILFNGLGMGDSFVRLGKWLKSLLRLGALGIAAVVRFLYGFLIRGSYNMSVEDSEEISRGAVETVKGMSSLDIILKAALIALAAYFLFRVIRRVMRVFLTRHKHVDETTERIVKRKEKKPERKEKLEGRDKLGGSMEARMRRLYRKKILAQKDYYTPTERDTTESIRKNLLSLNPELKEEELARLTEAYREVRYGGRVPTAREIRELKKLLQ